MFNPTHYENSPPSGVAVLEVIQDQPQSPQFVPLQRTTLQGRILGPLADLQVIHTFGYTRSTSDQTLEARYRFPLPGDAAVIAVTVRFGEVEIVAELKERQHAEQEYTQAKAEGRQAALATRTGADAFTLQVAGLQPDQPIEITTHYLQLARREGDRWTLRIPLTLAPRYVRHDELGARHAQGQPLALLRDPGHRFALDLQIAGVNGVSSPTHELAVTAADGAQRVRLQGGEVIPDRDCVITWQSGAGEAQPLLSAYGYAEAATGQLYFLALVAPPALRPAREPIPRELILLVDHSGSMTGPKWAAADWAVERFLAGLGENDRFALGVFHTTTHWFATQIQPATAAALAGATAWFKAQTESGGTELGVALEQALHLSRTTDDRARHVLVITDAEVTDAARILRLADDEAAHPQRRRISVLCIDAAPNAYLAQELADRGGGVARFLTSDPEAEDITTALETVLADWAEPLLTNLTLKVNRPHVVASGRRVQPVAEGQSQIDLGDLTAGQMLWVAACTTRQGGEPLQLAVQTARGRAIATTTLADDDARATPALKALFGARRITALETLIAAGYEDALLRQQLARLGYDPAAVLPPAGSERLYAENRRTATAAALSDLLRKEALHYGLASSETAFVATRREAGQVVTGTVAVANALPSGWSDQFLGATPLAAPMSANVVMGSALALPPQSLPAPVTGFLNTVGSIFTGGGQSLGTAAKPGEQKTAVFAGKPNWQAGEATLLALEGAGQGLPATATITKLRIEFQGQPPATEAVGTAEVLIYLADPATPRARIRLADLLRLGERPLNLRRQDGQQLTIILRDPDGKLTHWPGQLTVTLSWRAG